MITLLTERDLEVILDDDAWTMRVGAYATVANALRCSTTGMNKHGRALHDWVEGTWASLRNEGLVDNWTFIDVFVRGLFVGLPAWRAELDARLAVLP